MATTDKKADPDQFDTNFSVSHLLNKQTSHKIRDLKPNEKNLELRFIVLEKRENTVTKRGKVSISTFLVADESAAIFANFYSNRECITPGDIIYINGAYTSIFKNQLILYEGKQGLKMKIGEFFFNFNEETNMSIGNWNDYMNPETSG